MKTIKSLVLGCAVLLAGGTSAYAQQPTDLNNLVGTWVNVDSATRGTVKIIITKNGSQLYVHTYGACHPTPCDHGQVSAEAFSPSVSSNKATGFSANYDHGFVTRLITGRRSGALLNLESRSKFATGDTRYDYLGVEQFRKR
jgi:hypothetical protein